MEITIIHLLAIVYLPMMIVFVFIMIQFGKVRKMLHSLIKSEMRKREEKSDKIKRGREE